MTAAAVPEASSPADAKPFLKWVGGKRQLLSEILRHAPVSFGRYHEPFVGGGALFFHLRQMRACPAFLTDSNQRLIRAYRGVQQDVEGVIALLRDHERKHGRPYFNKVREQRDIDSATATEVAAWMIYLNRTGYNGLYRVNSKGEFNVPFGRYKKPNFCDEENLHRASEALAGVKLLVGDFETASNKAKPGDAVYFDPPYDPVSKTSSFTAYHKDEFGRDDHERLRGAFARLAERGVAAVLSNSDTPFTRGLFSAWTTKRVHVSRPINSKGAQRGAVRELLVKSEPRR